MNRKTATFAASVLALFAAHAEIKNPILPGFNPDPSICRKGKDFYLAVSSFEWFPGLPIYHSRDLKNWELYSHVLTDAERLDLRKLPSAKGVWAPCLTYDEREDLFYVIYGVVNNMNGGCFDIDNYLVTAKDPAGPWSEPVYLHSTGFDASIFHDDDGRKYIVALECESRAGRKRPGPISVVEYDPRTKSLVGLPKIVSNGVSGRGWQEGPHITRRNGFYYLMLAEGGTWYSHCATVSRSKSVFGPYEPDPVATPILSSTATRGFNPALVLQKAGHADYVDLPNGETWLVHHVGRPFTPEQRCTLGRETCIQRAKWTDDGWLRLENGTIFPDEFVKESAWLEACPLPRLSSRMDFDGAELPRGMYAPRIDPSGFCDLNARPGWLRMRGQESPMSLNRVSLLARKLTSVQTTVTTRLDFEPLVYQQTAGLAMYYDNLNFFYLAKCWSDTVGGPALQIVRYEQGRRTETEPVAVEPGKPLTLRLSVRGRKTFFEWAYDGGGFVRIGDELDTSLLSDEHSKVGEFTGTMVGIMATDRFRHERTADFDFFEIVSDDTADVDRHGCPSPCGRTAE